MTKKLIGLFVVTFCLMGQTSALRPRTILNPIQLPPVTQQSPVIWGEVPQPGTAANTWMLTDPVTQGIAVFWNGVRQTVGADFTFTGNGTGGTLLTLTPAAVAVGAWSTGTLVADYQ
jgi:hypothetical protein